MYGSRFPSGYWNFSCLYHIERNPIIKLTTTQKPALVTINYTYNNILSPVMSLIKGLS